MSFGGQRGNRPDLKELSGWETWARGAWWGRGGETAFSHCIASRLLGDRTEARRGLHWAQALTEAAKRNGEPDLIDPDGLALDDLRETDALHLTEEERDRRLRKGKPWGQAVGEREPF